VSTDKPGIASSVFTSLRTISVGLATAPAIKLVDPEIDEPAYFSIETITESDEVPALIVDETAALCLYAALKDSMLYVLYGRL